jgi:hypothetical protein
MSILKNIKIIAFNIVNLPLKFIWNYDGNLGHIFFKMWRIDFKDVMKKHERIVEAVKPPQIIFEIVKMSVGLFLIKHPMNDWKIYGGCVFIMLVAVYFRGVHPNRG